MSGDMSGEKTGHGTLAAPLPVATIVSYHAHVYFDGAGQRAIALRLREEIAARFPVSLGRVFDRLIGPHARPMYQVSFEVPVFATLIPWLMLNRSGLSILIHPNTTNERADHLERALWLGAPLPILHAADLAEENEPQAANAINTSPSIEP